MESKPSIADELYRQTAADYGAALGRLAGAYEADSDRRRDLLQEIHFALWRSFESFDGRCSLRTWIYRVAHNTAASHAFRRGRAGNRLVSLEEIDARAPEPDLDRKMALDRLRGMIHQLKPLDRQIMLSYLEGLDATGIGEITGLSAPNVATKIHRIKNILSRRFEQGGHHA